MASLLFQVKFLCFSSLSRHPPTP
uniref:Uncharacterized protein n=1 Tax=Rhizophora mucronata TaxID=61149 RepID=A0A2P2K0D2_RHIMU